ncbi:uncharacterized protein [Zea mays]|uniref:uncharacterized protein n=1 Tax=Zea mays TaxID=4577 RepID=UPI0004DE7F49|nr:uncharacterized protein LOC103628925 [Zea mays]|eukprot:XP_008648338.1 uncharacterized protein LOC103628925 [Zea mays]
MRGDGRGGGGRQPSYAAPDGANAVAIPVASRKMVQSLKRILADRSEGEIYATLCDCGMDPDIAVERLISQDPCTTKVEPDKARVVACNRPHRYFVILLIEFIGCLISAYLIPTQSNSLAV